MPIKVKACLIGKDQQDFSVTTADILNGPPDSTSARNKFIKSKTKLRAFLSSSLGSPDIERNQFIKHIANQLLFLEGLRDFQKSDKKWPNEERDFAELTINLPQFESRYKNNPDQFDVSDLSFKMSKTDAHRIANKILEIVRNPELVLTLLQDLDSQLGKRMKAAGVSIKDNSPDYVVAGLGQFVPGPWQERWKPLNKGKILDKLLLEIEQKEGINLGGVAVFSTVVDPLIANNFVAAGNIFSEDERYGGFVSNHGKKSHRLILEVIRQAFLKKELDLKLENGETLNHRQLLEFLAKAYINENEQSEERTNIFQFTIDNTRDTIEAGGGDGLFDPAKYCFSSRSPLVLKSLIICLGRDRLQNLASYMLDSHYKLCLQSAESLKSGIEKLRFMNDDDVADIFKACNITAKDTAMLSGMTYRELSCFDILYRETVSSRDPSGFHGSRAFSRADPLYYLLDGHLLPESKKRAIETRYQPFSSGDKVDAAGANQEGWGIVSKKPYPSQIDKPVGYEYTNLEEYLGIKRMKEGSRMKSKGEVKVSKVAAASTSLPSSSPAAAAAAVTTSSNVRG